MAPVYIWYRNLTSFHPVALKFTRLKCIQQLSICTWGCFTTVHWGTVLPGRTGYTLGFAALFSASLTVSIIQLSPIPSVGLSVPKEYCGKTVDWIRMPFRVMSGVGRMMGLLDAGGDRRREGAVLGVNLRCPIVTSGDFVA